MGLSFREIRIYSVTRKLYRSRCIYFQPKCSIIIISRHQDSRREYKYPGLSQPNWPTSTALSGWPRATLCRPNQCPSVRLVSRVIGVSKSSCSGHSAPWRQGHPVVADHSLKTRLFHSSINQWCFHLVLVELRRYILFRYQSRIGSNSKLTYPLVSYLGRRTVSKAQLLGFNVPVQGQNSITALQPRPNWTSENVHRPLTSRKLDEIYLRDHQWHSIATMAAPSEIKTTKTPDHLEL